MKTNKSTNRRNFLLAASVGSAGAVAAVVTQAGKEGVKPDSGESRAQPSGYHVSEHILKYYKTTEV